MRCVVCKTANSTRGRPVPVARAGYGAAMSGAFRSIVVLKALTMLLGAAHAQEQTQAQAKVELAPFAGFQFGGSFASPNGAPFSLNHSLDYGASLDVAIAESWRVGFHYSRQQTELRGRGSSFDLTVERWMATVSEEKGEGRNRFFGEGLFGFTRHVPGLNGFDSDSRFTVGAGLGVKRRLSGNFGVRLEARGYYTFTETNGGLFCNGECLFLFGGSGLFQGELSAGLILGF